MSIACFTLWLACLAALRVVRLGRTDGAPEAIDREKTCPLLLRVFVKQGRHHSESDFAVKERIPTADETLVYTWPDASLRELVNCVKETCEEARQPNVRLSLAFVYTDAKGEVHMRNVGVLHTSKRGRDDDKILRTLRFQTGDFLDCAVLTAL